MPGPGRAGGGATIRIFYWIISYWFFEFPEHRLSAGHAGPGRAGVHACVILFLHTPDDGQGLGVVGSHTIHIFE